MNNALKKMREQNIKRFAEEHKTQEKKLDEQKQKTLLNVPANRIKVLKKRIQELYIRLYRLMVKLYLNGQSTWTLFKKIQIIFYA